MKTISLFNYYSTLHWSGGKKNIRNNLHRALAWINPNPVRSRQVRNLEYQRGNLTYQRAVTEELKKL